MKLYGNTGSRGVARQRSAPGGAATAVLERPQGDSRRFRRGFLIYVLVMLLLIAAGLTVLWFRMDVYERSLPVRALEAWMDARSSADWAEVLTEQGVEPGFVDSQDLRSPEYYKNLSVYTDEAPAFTLSFAARPLLTVTLRPGEKLGFGCHGWTVDAVTAVDSGLAVYVPPGAVVTVGDAVVGPECLVQRDAQKLSLGVFEQGRGDIPGLDKYVLNRCFTVDNVTVTGPDGSALTPEYTVGNAYYYPPVTADVHIVAPADATVTVNGVALSAENADARSLPPETDEFALFEGIEDALPFTGESMGRTAWTVSGLVAAPEVAAALSDGTALTAEHTDGTWSFPSPPAGKPDPALAAEQETRIMEVFDAHIAYLGNRSGAMETNYARFIACLVPNGEAFTQARRARDSIIWAKGLNTHPDAHLGEVLRYHPDCFTAQVDFTPEGDPDGPVSSNIYIFVRYAGQWRVLRIVSK